MKIQLDFLTNFSKYLPYIIALLALFGNVFVLYYRKQVTDKIQNNELKHVTADVKELKQNEKEYKVDLKKDLDKIFRRLGKIEKIQYAQQKICDLRHSKDRK